MTSDPSFDVMKSIWIRFGKVSLDERSGNLSYKSEPVSMVKIRSLMQLVELVCMYVCIGRAVCGIQDLENLAFSVLVLNFDL